MDVQYIIFSNHEVDSREFPRVTVIPERKRGWPDDSALRFQFIRDHANATALAATSYAFWSDADAAFVDDACFEMMVRDRRSLRC